MQVGSHRDLPRRKRAAGESRRRLTIPDQGKHPLRHRWRTGANVTSGALPIYSLLGCTIISVLTALKFEGIIRQECGRKILNTPPSPPKITIFRAAVF